MELSRRSTSTSGTPSVALNHTQTVKETYLDPNRLKAYMAQNHAPGTYSIKVSYLSFNSSTKLYSRMKQLKLGVWTIKSETAIPEVSMKASMLYQLIL